MARLAVILFNLGGPDCPEAVRPFLFNLFKDKAIIGLPGGLRHFVAWLIARQRAPVARGIYEILGGRSPILELTRAQADALQARLSERDAETRVFVAMRYWHPLTEKTVAEVKEWGAERVLLLPLYPQYSLTTTGSSARAWEETARKLGLGAVTRLVRSYPVARGMIAAQIDLLRQTMSRLDPALGPPRVLFSAHGLPKKLVDRGDPYPVEVNRTVAAIVNGLGREGLDWALCYQSRVGPLEWIGPSTESEIKRAGAEGRPLVVLPVAFVSEHSETLVELDVEYAHLAEKAGVPAYLRVPALGTHPDFIGTLAELVWENSHERRV